MALGASKASWSPPQSPGGAGAQLPALLSLPAATQYCWLWNKTKEKQLQLNKQLMQRSKRKQTKHNLKENNSKHQADALFSLPWGTDAKKRLKSLKSTSNLTGARFPSLLYIRDAIFFSCMGVFLFSLGFFVSFFLIFIARGTLLFNMVSSLPKD